LSGLRFVWDAPKAARNLRLHRVSFEEAKSIFDDPDVLIKPDIEHSILEERAQAVGISRRLRVLVVVVVDVEEDVVRIITARRATANEAAEYAKRKAQRRER
jgi:uncharacterized DUF497 family protein